MSSITHPITAIRKNEMGTIDEMFAEIQAMFDLVDRIDDKDARLRLTEALSRYIKNYVLLEE